MKVIFLFISVLGALAPSTLFSQGKNRISLQTGLFHCFFDGTKIIDGGENYINKNYKTVLGGIFKDSRGLQYQRLLTNNFTISAEYMKFSAGYNYQITYNNSKVKPILIGRNYTQINLTFSKKHEINDKIQYNLGVGMNYIFGYEVIYHYTSLNGWGEPRFLDFNKKNWGFNLRTGIEYYPKKWLTLYTNIDFIGIVFLNTTDSKGMNTNTLYKAKYGMKNVPSRTDLSLRFGIGFNF